MKTLILDKKTITVNNDVDLDAFNQFGKVIVYDNLTDQEEIIQASDGVSVIVVNKVMLNDVLIARLPDSVKLIAIVATGYDNVDVSAASRKGIQVANVPGYGTNAVSQLAIFLMLSCAIQFVGQIDYMRSKGWNKMAGLELTMHELSGKTLGILGFGEIGLATAKLAQAFGMTVIAYSRSLKQVEGIKQLPLLEVAKQADFISLHSVLAPATARVINKEFLQNMKPTAYLINTARGGLVDEEALAQALNTGQIAGAALDVLSNEPPEPGNPLLKTKNTILTPHIGWAPIEARQRCVDLTVQNIINFMAGNPTNLLG